MESMYIEYKRINENATGSKKGNSAAETLGKQTERIEH